MELQDYQHDMERCSRCSFCKWIPWRAFKNNEFTSACPAAARYQWHSFSAGGKFNMAYSWLKKRIDYSPAFLEAVYRCHMDGNCDVSCKAIQDIEPLQNMQALRIQCVKDGQLIPAHQPYIESLRKEGNMLLSAKTKRGDWAAGLAVKDISREKAEVAYHAGCRYAYDKELWPTVRGGLSLLLKAGVDVGILRDQEGCCGGRAYELGYVEGLSQNAERQEDVWQRAGVKTLVTPCSDCYASYKVLYDKIGKKLGIEVLHITEYLERLIKEGRLQMKKKVPLTVTYHDPCHLGRLAEPWVHWQGKEVKVMGNLITHVPPKKFRRGANGVYEIPRIILSKIPGLKFVEMYRIKEFAWCCGSGGGVKEAYPDFAIWTANERIKEAKSVGAEAIVSACGWCTRNFRDAAKETGNHLETYDILDLIQQAV
jgi:Fe-S oxidoreductase